MFTKHCFQAALSLLINSHDNLINIIANIFFFQQAIFSKPYSENPAFIDEKMQKINLNVIYLLASVALKYTSSGASIQLMTCFRPEPVRVI